MLKQSHSVRAEPVEARFIDINALRQAQGER